MTDIDIADYIISHKLLQHQDEAKEKNMHHNHQYLHDYYFQQQGLQKQQQEEEHREEELFYFVAVDTRGLSDTDFQEGLEELTCPRECFLRNVMHDPYTKCVTCPLAESCGLYKHMKIYFREYYLGEGSRPLEYEEIDREVAWSELFANEEGDNNPAASLLTMDHSNGCARYNIQGVAYVVYDEGMYAYVRQYNEDGRFRTKRLLRRYYYNIFPFL
jgi:hypothetical protein